MRTTLTLDDDVAFGLKRIIDAEPEKPFKQVVNDVLRKGLRQEAPVHKKRRVKIVTRDMGLRDGLSYDNIEELLDIVEGPLRK
jgi:hypothetical protein